jgi:putative redox protein
MKATVTWEDGMRHRAQTASGHEILIDGDGQAGPSSMELVISAMGGCSSIDVVMILQKGRQSVTACRCELSSERAESSPRVFTSIHAHFVVAGENLNEKHVKRAVELSLDKYCSVALMLNKAVEITHSFEITPAL